MSVQLFLINHDNDIILDGAALLYCTSHACTQVRGPKVIVRWFSHDVADLEFVLSLIEAQDRDDHDVRKCRSCDT